MKQLLVILLFVSAISYGQEINNETTTDTKPIDIEFLGDSTANEFVLIVINNKYYLNSSPSDPGTIIKAMNPSLIQKISPYTKGTIQYKMLSEKTGKYSSKIKIVYDIFTTEDYKPKALNKNKSGLNDQN